jgi:FkbM family methyltransferase
MSAPWADIARARIYRAASRVAPERLVGLPGLGLAERLVGRGSIAVAGGPAKDLRLGARDIGLTHIQSYGLVRGTLEPSVQEALRRHVRPGAVVYDIGANVGFFSLLAARLAGPGGVVEAFEPVPRAVAALRRNVALNGFGNVHVHEAAVGAHDGTGTLLVTEQASCSHLADRGWHADTRETIDVRVVTLDALVGRAQLRPADVLKIDVEGSELSVVQGMSELLRRSRPVLICELHATNDDFLGLMADAGYEVENLDGPDPIGGAGHVHALARPSVR